MSMSAIERFIDRVQKMTTGRSKEMRLTYDEAFALVLAFSDLSAKLLIAEEKLKESDDGVVIISGGKLKRD